LLGLSTQARAWQAGYALFAAVTLVNLVLYARTPARAAPEKGGSVVPLDAQVTETRPRGEARLRWLFRSAVPSALLLAVTFWISMDVAAVPLLWIVPLSLYLVTFVIAFAARVPFPRRALVIAAMLAIALGLLCVMVPYAALSLRIGSSLAALFLGGWVCHGDLARDAPEPARATEYYLWIAAGGFVGGLLG